MQGFSPKLPLTKDNTEGLYLMNKTASESIKQDLKMLVLTSPGERIMIPDYGVGIRRYLFDNNTLDKKTEIIQKIRSQVQRYMNFLQVNDIQILDDENNQNAINLSIYYEIPAANSEQELSISVMR